MGIQSDNPYMKVGDSSDVTQVNPYTDQAFSELFGEGGFLSQFLGGMGKYEDPMAGFNAFLGYAPALQEIVTGASSPYGTALFDQARALSAEGMNNVLAQYGGSNLYGGGAVRAASQAAQTPLLEAMTQLSGQQMGLFGNLAGTALGQMPGAYASAADRYAGLGASALGQYGAFAAPEWWQPTYVEDPSYMSGQDWLNSGIGLVGAIGSFFGG